MFNLKKQKDMDDENSIWSISDDMEEAVAPSLPTSKISRNKGPVPNMDRYQSIGP